MFLHFAGHFSLPNSSCLPPTSPVLSHSLLDFPARGGWSALSPKGHFGERRGRSQVRLSLATTCNSISCGSRCWFFPVLSFYYFPGTDTVGWGVGLSGNVGTDPPSPPVDVTFKVTSHPRLLPFYPGQLWGWFRRCPVLTCPLVSSPWNKNSE